MNPRSLKISSAAATLLFLFSASLALAQNSGTNSAIAAGVGNVIVPGSRNAFIGAGNANAIAGANNFNSVIISGINNSNLAGRAVIVGGRDNTIGLNSRSSTISGGETNSIFENSTTNTSLSATIGGGQANIIGGTATGATIGGGVLNEARAAGASVPGGSNNIAGGTNSFAAGQRARATNTGTFVWADSSVTNEFGSTSNNQFLIRATGGVGINTNNPGSNALSVGGRTQISGDLQVSGNIQGNVSSTNAALSSVSSTNAFTILTGGTLAWTASVQGTNVSPSFGASFAGRNIVAGHPSNSVASGVVGATISGGGGVEVGAGNGFNSVSGNFGTIGGGFGNIASGEFSFIGGGEQNSVSALYSVIGGGFRNQATNAYAFVAGGDANIAGGEFSAVAGGQSNQATGVHASIPGGLNNEASGTGSFAAGVRAKATNNYSFVWGGDPTVDTKSFGTGTYTARAPQGARFITGTTNGVDAGVTLSANATSWSSLSDSNAKTDIQPLDHRQTLAKLAGLPVTKWRYKHDTSREYIGPMAQDFHATFGLGSDDKHITTLDTDGVTLSAIKGLVEELREQEAKLAERDERMRMLEMEIESLKTQVGL